MKRGWDENIYAIWNPIPVYNGREVDKEFFTGGRTPLVIAVSKDNGQTFTDPVAFEEEPDRGYCYCALHFTKEALLPAYCAGGKEDGKLPRPDRHSPNRKKGTGRIVCVN